jgi:hypothetical protein
VSLNKSGGATPACDKEVGTEKFFCEVGLRGRELLDILRLFWTAGIRTVRNSSVRLDCGDKNC